MSMTKFHKQQLRDCARLALKRRGLHVEIKQGPGIVAGARLRTFEGSYERTVAVRTSLDREVGFARNADGDWLTIPKVDEVVVAAPSIENPASAEILCFDRDVMIKVFDATLAAAKNRSLSHKVPIFIALDDAKAGLKAKAKWRTLVPLAAASAGKGSSPGATEAFIDRVKREFAEMIGVDASKIALEFRIIT
jgi:hypothetical protein